MIDETENLKDALQPVAGQPSEGQKGTLSQPPKTYTEAEVQKTISDALSRAGRDAKTLDALKKQAESEKAEAGRQVVELKEWQERRDQEELERVRNDPDLLRAYQDKQSLRREQDKIKQEKLQLEREKLEHREALEAMKRFRKEQAASQIASRYEGVDADTLLDLTDGTSEKMDALAQRLAKPKAETPSGKPDQGMTFGSSFTELEIREKYISGEITREQRSEKLKALGIEP